MTKKSKGWKLGLHTLEEQSVALQLALQAVAAADQGLESDNMNAVWHSVGYLVAIRDLALAEGASGLVKNIEDLLGLFLERARVRP